MKKLNLISLILFTLIFTSCSRQFKISRIVAGSTYIGDAVELLDEPEVLDESQKTKGQILYVWKDISLQVDKNEIVTSIQRKPANHETSLQFWRHHYKEKQTTFNKVSANTDSNLWQFNIPSEGINIIYDDKIDIVTKVIFYEAK